jgi:hypothetical protein
MATLALLADAASTANTLIDTFLWVYILLLFVYVLISWVRLPYTVWVRRVSEFCGTSASRTYGSSGGSCRRSARSTSRPWWPSSR